MMCRRGCPLQVSSRANVAAASLRSFTSWRQRKKTTTNLSSRTTCSPTPAAAAAAAAAHFTSSRATVTVFVTAWPCPLPFDFWPPGQYMPSDCHYCRRASLSSTKMIYLNHYNKAYYTGMYKFAVYVKILSASSLKELFQSIDNQTVTDFIKEIYFLSPTVIYVIYIFIIIGYTLWCYAFFFYHLLVVFIS